MRQLYEELEGKDSEGWKRCNEDLLNINDIQLKRRAGKYRDFFEQNNEKLTSIFFSQGKEKEGDDNIGRIRNDLGRVFTNDKDREKYIRNFYSNLYKRRIDRLIEIEDFLGRDRIDNQIIRSRKLTYLEKNSLERMVTIEELKKSLDKSNMNPACGWDGVSYFLIKQY